MSEPKRINLSMRINLSLDEVQECDYAYILIKDDPEIHCFLRMHTTDTDVSFDRPIATYGKVITGSAHSQPHLLKNLYGRSWIAFRSKPDQWQLNGWRDLIEHLS